MCVGVKGMRREKEKNDALFGGMDTSHPLLTMMLLVVSIKITTYSIILYELFFIIITTTIVVNN